MKPEYMDLTFFKNQLINIALLKKMNDKEIKHLQPYTMMM